MVFLFIGGIKLRKRFYYLIVSLLVAGGFALTQIPAWANSGSIVDIVEIPSEYGTAKEIFNATYTTDDEKGVIIHLQDAHCNYEAQKNMAGLLEYLVKEYGVKLIMVEGGSGDVSLSFLRTYADETRREQVADEYLKMGKISGEEYLDIVSDYDLELYGIEDKSVYNEHMDAFLELDSVKRNGLAYLRSLSNITNRLKPLMYSKELASLEQMRVQYAQDKVSLAQYCRYLFSVAQQKDLELWNYFHLNTFCEAAQLEQNINFKLAESQRNALIKQLASVLDESAVEELVEKSRAFKSGELSTQDFYIYLINVAGSKINLARDYQEFNNYAQYLTASKTIDTPELLKEVSEIETEIEEIYLANANQRKLRDISKSIQILTKLLKLELTPEDYAYLQDNKSKFITSSWTDFLAGSCRSHNLKMRPFTNGAIDDNFKKLEKFYELGTIRDEVFIKNITDIMDKHEHKLAVLITGGFHTPGLTSALKEKDYSYIVVAPVITQKTDSDVYLSVLKTKNSQ